MKMFSVLFARDSLLISAFVLVLTVVLKNITKAKEVPPVWIATLSTAVAQKVFYNYYASVCFKVHCKALIFTFVCNYRAQNL